MTEQELITKYKTAGIIKGSLKPGTKHHKNKNTVRCKCKGCGKVTEPIATSDIWLKRHTCGQKINGKKGE